MLCQLEFSGKERQKWLSERKKDRKKERKTERKKDRKKERKKFPIRN